MNTAPDFESLTRDRQTDCDSASFFVGGRLLEELSTHEIARHNCLHLINVIAKLTRTGGNCNTENLRKIEEEVAPDLLVYAIQIASAFRVQWLQAFIDSSGFKTDLTASKVTTFADLQELIVPDRDVEISQVVDDVRVSVTEVTSRLARRCDKRDHLEDLPSVDIQKDIVLPLLTNSLKLAKKLGLNPDGAYARRLQDIKEKYGDVRLLLGTKVEMTTKFDVADWTDDADKAAHIADTYRTLRRSQEEQAEPYRIFLGGEEFIVSPNVFPPSYYNDTEFFAKNLPIDKGDEFLEIGPGTGIISIVAAKKGATRVLALDINKDAVINTRINTLLHNFENVVETRWSDVYSELSEKDKFDKIFWNVPFGLVKKDLNMLERSVFDKGYGSIEKFILGASRHLKPGGKVYVGFSSVMGRRDLLDGFIERAGFRAREVASKIQTEGRAQALTFEIIELTL